jgi:hypothetical protein
LSCLIADDAWIIFRDENWHKSSQGMKAKDCPWNCPVPIRKSSFLGLRPSDAKFNLETDLGRISSFHLARKPLSEKELLFCDQQTNVIGNVPRRGGSGRSGFYQGRYLKGCGRTFLALNWNDEDRYHNTGHLLPSAAIREYVVTRYLAAKGGLHAIVPCEGLLLRPLSKELKNCPDLLLFGKASQSPRIDAHFQAITHKPGTFARASNFVWFLDNAATLPRGDTEFNSYSFLSLFARFLEVPGSLRKESELLSPERIGELYAASLERTFAGFGDFYRHGVYWGSFYNNFTLDGRFLDLELAQMFGGPFLGAVSKIRKRRLSGYLPGSFTSGSFFAMGAQLRAMTGFMRNRIDFLIRNRYYSGAYEADYLKAFLRSLDREVNPRWHWLYQKNAMIQKILAVVDDCTPLSATERKEVQAILNSHWEQTTSHDARGPKLEVERLDMPPVRSEGPRQVSWYAPKFLAERADYLDEVRWLYERLERLYGFRDMDRVLQGVLDLEKEIDNRL